MNTVSWLLPVFIYFSSTGNMQYFYGNKLQRNNYAALNVSVGANSNSINAEMLRFYMRGRYIYDDMKIRSLNRMKSTNRLGLEAIAEASTLIGADSLFKSKGWSFYVGLKSRIIFNASFNKDFYTLGLFGNAPFEGDTAQLGSPSVNNLSYQQVSFGLVKRIEKQYSSHTLGAALSYVNGSSFFHSRITNASLYTATDGQNIQAVVNGEFRQSDASKVNYFYPNGKGAALDFFYNWADQKNALQFNVTDAGFIAWNRFSQKTQLDTTIYFDGVNVNDVFRLDETFFTNLSDSVSKAFNNRAVNENYISALPMNVNLTYQRVIIPEKLILQPAVNMKFFANYFPQFSLSAIGYPDPAIMISGSVRYGGWGGFNVGLDLGFDLGQGWVLGIGSRTIDGFVVENINSGLSGNFSLMKYFSKPQCKKKVKTKAS